MRAVQQTAQTVNKATVCAWFEGSCSGRRDKNSDALVFGVKICQNQLCDDLLQKREELKRPLFLRIILVRATYQLVAVKSHTVCCRPCGSAHTSPYEL